MKTEKTGSFSFNELVEQHLGGRLPAELAGRVSFPELPKDARDFIFRMLSLMRRASVPATEITPHMIWLLSAVNPAMLPSAWGGRIPPLTAPGRHRKLDDYVARKVASRGNGRPVFVDLGCGFPPLTAVDTAAALPDWSVFGVDRAFSRYVFYDPDGAYACFDRDGNFQYLQSPQKPLNDTPAVARSRFQHLFSELFPRLNRFDEKASETVEKDGHRLVCNHIRDFEAENLAFVKSDVESLRLPPARVARCMNVLLYFEKPVREKMLTSIAGLLDEGGLLITGFNHPAGIYARYAVFEKAAAGGLRPCEFAFSADNLRPLGTGPWVTLEDEDQEAELLADLTCALRADGGFWEKFDRRVDALQEQLGICRRGKDGFLRFSDDAQTALPPAVVERTAALWRQIETEGFTDGAVEALTRAGYRAWKNPVGDIAVLPPEGALPAPAV
ncbi:MAG: CheR family methyltransferase [Desulfobacterales bacterium]|jgi:hypothetical protein